MDARERKAIESAQQAYQQIKETVDFLVERYAQRVIDQCMVYLDGDAATAIAEQVIAETVRTLGDYQGDDLSTPILKMATKMAKAKYESMWLDRWKADAASGQQKGKSLKEREDNALIRFRKIAEMPWKQIADIMGMTEGQARVRCHRALQNRPEIKNVR